MLRWKATELRNFFLYTGLLALKSILSEKLYDHCMLLSVAIRILRTTDLAENFFEYAQK